VTFVSTGVGDAQCTSSVPAKSVGKLGAGNFEVRAIVKGTYYTDNEPKTDHVFTVAKPFASNYVVGDGEIPASGSTGSHAGDAGTVVDLGFASRQVSASADPTHYLVVLHSGGHTYRITGSTGSGLPDAPPDATVHGTSATITDITNPAAPVVVDSGGTVTFVVHHATGGSDTAGLTILDHLNNNWFAQAPTALSPGGVRVV
jgi:hypothetical protein